VTGVARVVIVGAGFGGLRAARDLARADVAVTVIDRANHHLFQPLLYQVATAVLAPTEIISPIRHLLRGQRNAVVWLADVSAIDVAARTVQLHDGRHVAYDFLIVAAGSQPSYFGRAEWERNAPGLKTLVDALEIRRRFLTAFEVAEQHGATNPLSFVIIGGGPTGVELAGMLPDITRFAFPGEFRRIDPGRTRVVLIEGGDRLLPTFAPSASARALADLASLGVEVRLDARVTRVEADAVYLDAERIPADGIFWAAGNSASALGRTLGVPVDRAGRVLVEGDLSIPGHPEVFVVGDLAAVPLPGGGWVPGVAPAATQMGAVAAENVKRTLRGEARQVFTYRDRGQLATIGRRRAVAQFGRRVFTGAPAWFLWLFVHILYLAGFRNRLAVLIEWAYAYLTYRRGARLITQDAASLFETRARDEVRRSA
jgi:NADH:quinone reductase (non-electrogenic)